MSRAGRIAGAGAAFVVALGTGAASGWLAAPEPWRAAVRGLLGLAPAEAPKPVVKGWGAAAPAAPAAPAPEPLIDFSALAWMAWTPATGAFFLFILTCLAVMTGLELARPGGAPRRGVLGLDTTRGDRLFISLLGSAWILLGWLGLMGTPLWGGVAVAVAWAGFVFWKA